MLAPLLIAGAALGFFLLRRQGEQTAGTSALAAEILRAANPDSSRYSPEQQIMVALSAYHAGFFRTAIDLAEMAADRIDEEPSVSGVELAARERTILEAARLGLDPSGSPLATTDHAIALKFNVAAEFAANGFGNPFAVELLAAAATDIAMQMDVLDAPGADVFGGGHDGPGGIIWPGPAPVSEAV